MPCASQCATNHSIPSRLPCTYCSAIFGPCLPTIFDVLVPCSRLIFAVVLPVAPAPAECASSTSTSLPARASNTAVINPVSPAPTTAMSVDRSDSPGGFGGDGRPTRSASHSEVMAWLYPDRQG